MRNYLSSLPRPQRAFTLLEVLVAVAIFSIGLLGIAGLQVAGMRYTSSAALRTEAVMAAENLLDRMRANPLGVSDDTRPFNLVGNALPASFPTNCEEAPCNPQELALFDLVAWGNRLTATLPGGGGIICIDSTPDDGSPGAWNCDNLGDSYAVKVAWEERLAGADDVSAAATANDTVVKTLFLRHNP